MNWQNILSDLVARRPDGLMILSNVTGISETRLKAIANGAAPTYSEEIILAAHR